ncbi:MAG TPA: hypothetical protein VKE51_14570 [Vicinamibacterales bacterium]|nr:hypothetical protein [Vicinamibacterales bacterium]
MALALVLAAALAHSAAGATTDLTLPPGANDDKADSRLWRTPSRDRATSPRSCTRTCSSCA